MADSSGQSMSFSMKTTVYGIKKKFPSVNNITCQELEKWRKNGERRLTLLDTRPVEEYQVSHIPEAVQVDPGGECELTSLGISVDIATTVVCYCSVGYRSSSVAQKLLREHRRTREVDDSGNMQQPLDIYNLEGGVFQWACEGRELTNERGECVSTVHPYSSLWGKLLPSDLRHKM